MLGKRLRWRRKSGRVIKGKGLGPRVLSGMWRYTRKAHWLSAHP